MVVDAVDAVKSAQFAHCGGAIHADDRVCIEGDLQFGGHTICRHHAPSSLKGESKGLWRFPFEGKHPAGIRELLAHRTADLQMGQTDLCHGFERLGQEHGSRDLTTQHLHEGRRAHGFYAAGFAMRLSHMLDLVDALQDGSSLKVNPSGVLDGNPGNGGSGH